MGREGNHDRVGPVKGTLITFSENVRLLTSLLLLDKENPGL